MTGTRILRHPAPALLASAFLSLAVLASLVWALSSTAKSEDANTQILCLDKSDDCKTRIIQLPDGLPGQVLKFEFCQEGDCDRNHREHWRTQYLVPPPGEVCHNTDVNEALNWIEQNSRGWLLAGWGCVSGKRMRLPA